VLQHVAVCGSVLQCHDKRNTLNHGVFKCAAVCCSVLQCAAVCCSVSQCVTLCYSVPQCATACCSMLQCVAVCCSVLQCWMFTELESSDVVPDFCIIISRLSARSWALKTNRNAEYILKNQFVGPFT